MKLGLIRCMQTEDMCPGSTCLHVIKNRKLAFGEVADEIELVGMVTCGGCPGKRAVTRAAMLVQRGAEAIALASCISRGTPIGFPCPHYEQMREAIAKKVGDDIPVFDYTH